jgi:uncharacterized protein YecE (DUF72 family)
MEFGKVEASKLDTIDFSLPQDPPGNQRVLSAGMGNTQFYIGCARWGNKEWIGTYYPKGTKEKDFLSAYAKRFNCIELNATYYGTPSLAQVAAWKEKAGDGDFLFCPKLPQIITHTQKLQHTDELVNEFVYVMAGLGRHAGPVFLMPDPQMDTHERAVIMRFIAQFPPGAPLFLELRHPSFYATGYDAPLLAFLKEQGRGTIITDTAGRRDCVHMHLSVPEVYVRFVGNSLHPTDYMRIDEWIGRLKSWMDQGLEKLYFIMHQPDEQYTPVLIQYLIEQMNKRCGTTLAPPDKLPEEPDLPTLF